MKPGHEFIRSVRMLTHEIRLCLCKYWMTQAQLAKALRADQRTVNSRLQTMNRLGELRKRNEGYGTTEYTLK